jgi:hypothetical protein
MRLTVELEMGSEPIAGSVRESGGEAHRFAGYMDLMALLERLREDPEPDGQPADAREGR